MQPAAIFVHHEPMIALIVILVILAVAGVLGFVVKGLLWLAHIVWRSRGQRQAGQAIDEPCRSQPDPAATSVGWGPCGTGRSARWGWAVPTWSG